MGGDEEAAGAVGAGDGDADGVAGEVEDGRAALGGGELHVGLDGGREVGANARNFAAEAFHFAEARVGAFVAPAAAVESEGSFTGLLIAEEFDGDDLFGLEAGEDATEGEDAVGGLVVDVGDDVAGGEFGVLGGGATGDLGDADAL